MCIHFLNDNSHYTTRVTVGCNFKHVTGPVQMNVCYSTDSPKSVPTCLTPRTDKMVNKHNM